ncbi:FixH family protein [Jannaschia sp. W003]|uniref:FixH family protein n=1 Tax=Jannaschia sp. W003 TaxID=2867012 RepID=UPI0021A556E5|nr:FixH family protein [Jannaschia sp. W003]UWQ22423.1 FixH family protein [Jannaschia sp. W003]
MSRPLTGRRVLGLFALGFGAILVANATLAVNAVRSFPGLETRNSYVASQRFERERAAQEALGWTATAALDADGVVLDLRDARGPVGDARIEATLGRATSVADDVAPRFRFDGTLWRAPVVLAPGNWDLRLVAVAPDGTRFRRRLKLGDGR